MINTVEFGSPAWLRAMILEQDLSEQKHSAYKDAKRCPVCDVPTPCPVRLKMAAETKP